MKDCLHEQKEKKGIQIDLNNISKYMSLILRHKPEVIGIELDEHGWANVDDLICGIEKDNHGWY